MMLGFFCILAIFLGILMPSKKSITFLILILLWFLFAFNTNNGDYFNYETIYYGIGNSEQWALSQYEEGYVFLCTIGYKVFHFNYQQFIVFVSTLTSILLFLIVKLYSRYNFQNYIYILFMIFLYWMMICQYRFYIAFLLTLIGFYFLIENDSIKGTLLFVLFLLLGFLFHRSVILYLPFIIVKKVNIKKIIIVIPIVAIFFILLRSGLFSNLIYRFLPSFKIQNWLMSESNRSLIGIFSLILIRFLTIYIQYLLYNALRKRKCNENTLHRYELYLKISILSLSFIALEFFNKNYERLFRIPLMITFFMFCEYCSMRKPNFKNISILHLVFLGYLLLYLISYYISFSGWFEHNLIPILNENSIF